MPPKPGPPPRQVSRSRIRARRLGALAGVVLAALIVFAIVKIAGRRRRVGADDDGRARAAEAVPDRVPGGDVRARRWRTASAWWRRSRSTRATSTSGSRERRTCACRSRSRSTASARRRRNLEGFLFPATYDFLEQTTSRQLVQDQLDAFHQNWAKVDLSYARKKNLTPYDVLIIASLVEKEALAPDERPKIARVIYNRLHAHMNLGIDATTRYGLHVPGTKSLTQSRARELEPVQHAQPEHPRAAADADREPGPRVDAGRRASGGRQLAVLRPQTGQGAPLFHRQLQRLPQSRARLYGFYGSSRCSAIRSRTRSRRRCRTRRSPRAGSTGPTSRSTSARAARGGGARARRARLRRRERHGSAQGWRSRGSSAAELPSVNTLVGLEGHSTRRGDPRRD